MSLRMYLCTSIDSGYNCNCFVCAVTWRFFREPGGWEVIMSVELLHWILWQTDINVCLVILISIGYSQVWLCIMDVLVRVISIDWCCTTHGLEFLSCPHCYLVSNILGDALLLRWNGKLMVGVSVYFIPKTIGLFACCLLANAKGLCLYLPDRFQYLFVQHWYLWKHGCFARGMRVERLALHFFPSHSSTQ